MSRGRGRKGEMERKEALSDTNAVGEKRREANANERRRIREFNEAMRRLRELTKHVHVQNKKKGRKVTKVILKKNEPQN